MGEILLITSGNGGVGKSTTAVNIGACLASLSKSVVLVDGDVSMRELDVLLGLENRIVYDVIDLASRKCRSSQALIKDKRFGNLYLLSAARSGEALRLTSEQIVMLCDELKKEFDYVIIDCPVARNMDNTFARLADKVIVVAVPEVQSVRAADSAVSMLFSAGVNDPLLLVNKARADLIKQGAMLDIWSIEELVGIRLLGVIPQDDRIVGASNRGEPAVLDPKCKARESFEAISRELCGIRTHSSRVGIFSKLRSAIRSADPLGEYSIVR
ncbi:MAG: septum site-determining protein MinD [Clostridiales bacterium]|nr:septum site-determining protein MinD [Clostridiales bacterium]